MDADCQTGSRRGWFIPSAFLWVGLLLLCWISPKAAAETDARSCGPRPEILAELEKAAAIPILNQSAFDQNIAAFQSLRERHPNDLFVHESYQDAVQRFGVEGHLRVLTEEYQALVAEHSGELMYRYLYARSLIGRGTYPAIQEMNEILEANPEFAPARRMLVGIYSTEVFRDEAKEKIEREKFFSLCAGSVFAPYPSPAPDASPLIDQAERLLGEGGDPDRIADLAQQGLKDDEWRLQRIRPFDWYRADYKIQDQRQLQAEYWRVWSIQVRCYGRTGKPAKAAELLATMDQRAAQIRMLPGNAYWDALELLAELYAEGNQREQAEEKIDAMRKIVADHPDPARALQIAKLEKTMQVRRASVPRQ